MISLTYKASDKLKLFKEIVDEVYGKFTTQSSWQPKHFANREQRYLWTDAYGVVNYLTLYAETQQNQYLDQALILVENVHNILGKTRDGASRLGSATDEKPTLAGLRIGKPNPDGPGMSEDGQYFHYLTKWMIALNRLALVTKTEKYNDWSIDLAKAAHKAFVYKTGHGNLRMYWKMSSDLSKPLVPSEGGLDPYDGYTMFKILQDSSSNKTILQTEINDMLQMVNAKYPSYHTDDALDAGEALWLSSWYPSENYAKHLAREAGKAINSLWEHGEFSGASQRRLAFREFGTTIGVQEHPQLMSAGWNARVEELHQFWSGHLFTRDQDITPVMYCTSLVPGFCSANYSNSYLSK